MRGRGAAWYAATVDADDARKTINLLAVVGGVALAGAALGFPAWLVGTLAVLAFFAWIGRGTGSRP